MGKIIVLVLLILSAIASTVGYFYLTQRIGTGDQQVAAGQDQLAKGQMALDAGKDKLAAGKQELKQGKEKYADAHDNKLMVLADDAFNKGKGFKKGRDQIADGEQQVAAGELKINTGEKRIDAGELKLQQGMDQLQLAENIRLACATFAFIFTLVAIILGYYWRRSLHKTFKY